MSDKDDEGSVPADNGVTARVVVPLKSYPPVDQMRRDFAEAKMVPVFSIGAARTLHPTMRLRSVVPDVNHPGGPARLQQWWADMNSLRGEGEWRDIPTVYGDIPNPSLT